MNSIDAQGGCICGNVRYQLTGKPARSTVCHCPDCRRACGAQAVAWLTLPSENFQLLQGDPTCFRSSAKVVRTFCGVCGTSLTYQHDDHTQHMGVTTGSLDDPELFPPQKQFFEKSRLSWVKI